MGAMKLISTHFTESEVLMRFADDEDEKKAKQWIDVRVPVSELKVPVREGWLKKLDRDFGLPHGPDVENIGKIDNRSLSERRKAALERAQQILKEKSSQYKP
jgi:hypothetical protein